MHRYWPQCVFADFFRLAISPSRVFSVGTIYLLSEVNIEAYVWLLSYIGGLSVETVEERLLSKVKNVPLILCSLQKILSMPPKYAYVGVLHDKVI